MQGEVAYEEDIMRELKAAQDMAERRASARDRRNDAAEANADPDAEDLLGRLANMQSGSHSS